MKAMSPKHRRFVAEYLKDQNGTQAAIRAGYSPRTANEQACDLLAKPSIRAAVDKKLAEITASAGITRERVLRGLMNIAEFDPRKLYREDGTMRPMNELPAEIALAISTMESDDRDGELKKVKPCDKVKSLELLGKHLKMFDEPAVNNAPPMVINVVPATGSKPANPGD